MILEPMPILPSLFSRMPRGADQLPVMRMMWAAVFIDLGLCVAIGWVVSHFYFEPNLLTGFFNANSDTARVVFYVSAAVAILIGQFTVLAQQRRIEALAAEPAHDELAEAIDAQRWRAFLRVVFLVELVGVAALVIFLTIGSWRALIFLCGAGAVFNAQALPRSSWWNAADRPE